MKQGHKEECKRCRFLTKSRWHEFHACYDDNCPAKAHDSEILLSKHAARGKPMPSRAIQCLRVYANKDRNCVVRETFQEATDWLRYNKDMRPGCALFVDGINEQHGYLSEEECNAIEEELLEAGKVA